MDDTDAVRSRPDGQRAGSNAIWNDSAAAFGRWLSGEPGAMDELVNTMTPVLWQVVRTHGLDRDQAQDVVQTAWLTLVPTLRVDRRPAGHRRLVADDRAPGGLARVQTRFGEHPGLR